jgi:hypothetical protein
MPSQRFRLCRISAAHNGPLYLIHTGNEFADKKLSCESSAIETSEEMHSSSATEQFLQSKTQITGRIAWVIPVTSLPKGEVYEKTQSDFADLREP